LGTNVEFSIDRATPNRIVVTACCSSSMRATAMSLAGCKEGTGVGKTTLLVLLTVLLPRLMSSYERNRDW